MTQTVPDISPLMPMHQDPLLVRSQWCEICLPPLVDLNLGCLCITSSVTCIMQALGHQMAHGAHLWHHWRLPVVEGPFGIRKDVLTHILLCWCHVKNASCIIGPLWGETTRTVVTRFVLKLQPPPIAWVPLFTSTLLYTPSYTIHIKSFLRHYGVIMWKRL